MKKKLLVASMAAALSTMGGVASAALTVAENGVGHTLLVPYFTVQGNNATMINLVNTDQVNAKVVKVRFRGAEYSDDLFDFTVFLSPGDVFTGAVSQAADGTAQFSTSDNSCTLPSNINQKFVTARIGGSAASTREGYVEIITMADIPQAGVGSLYADIKHVNGVAPCGITTTKTYGGRTLLEVTPNDAGNYAAYATAVGMDLPTASLFANATIVDVPRASAYAVPATAIVDDTGPYAIIYSPQHPNPVAAGVWANWSSDNGLTDDVVTPDTLAALNAADTRVFRAALYDLPDLSTDIVNGAGAGNAVDNRDGLSMALNATRVTNEYLTDASLAAATDWVFSMPTRRYYGVYSGTNGPGDTGQFLGGEADTIFTNLTEENTIPLGGYQIFDREENLYAESPDDFVISPGTPDTTTLRLEGEVAVYSFDNVGGTTSTVLDAELTLDGTLPDFGFADGWMGIDLVAGDWPQGDTNAVVGAPNAAVTSNWWINNAPDNNDSMIDQGLPVIGFAATRATNGTLGNDAFNFGAAYPHRLDRP